MLLTRLCRDCGVKGDVFSTKLQMALWHRLFPAVEPAVVIDASAVPEVATGGVEAVADGERGAVLDALLELDANDLSLFVRSTQQRG